VGVIVGHEGSIVSGAIKAIALSICPECTAFFRGFSSEHDRQH